MSLTAMAAEHRPTETGCAVLMLGPVTVTDAYADTDAFILGTLQGGSLSNTATTA